MAEKNALNPEAAIKITAGILLGIAVYSLVMNQVCGRRETLPVVAQSDSEVANKFNLAEADETDADSVAEADETGADSVVEADSETASETDSEVSDASLQASIASKILRFHVLANSDSKEDQALKLLVRDAVGTYLEPLLSESSDLAETEAIVTGHLQEIEETAEAVVSEEGYDYSVAACLAWVEFPEKTYGDYTFPAGEYEALELVIGDGAGQNWWCVLYPNMCFRGSVYEVVDEDAEEELRQVLTPEEYEEVFSSGEVEVRSRLWDLIRNIFI